MEFLTTPAKLIGYRFPFAPLFVDFIGDLFEDFNIFFQQAIESLPEVMLTDLSEHSADGLSKRLDRLVDIYNRSQYAGRRKSSRTGQRTPHPIKARFVYELAKAFSGKWRKKTNQQAICDDLQSAGVFQLLACNLSPSDVKEIVEMISEGTMTNNEIALELCAKNFKIAPDTLDRHYLRGTAGHVTKLNEAFKKM